MCWLHARNVSVIHCKHIQKIMNAKKLHVNQYKLDDDTSLFSRQDVPKYLERRSLTHLTQPQGSRFTILGYNSLDGILRLILWWRCFSLVLWTRAKWSRFCEICTECSMGGNGKLFLQVMPWEGLKALGQILWLKVTLADPDNRAHYPDVWRPQWSESLHACILGWLLSTSHHQLWRL